MEPAEIVASSTTLQLPSTAQALTIRLRLPPEGVAVTALRTDGERLPERANRIELSAMASGWTRGASGFVWISLPAHESARSLQWEL